ncbi:MAG: hypothetical protein PF486_02390 [Prolixibacteraceae bacterium]|jgi:hypothetical protein|nr:hypothetical protein [Prolixibacteraceae bacterium]
MRIMLITLIVLCANVLYAQSKTEIIQKGIEVRRYYEQDIEDGEKELSIFKEEFFNVKGELVEEKTFDNQGSEIDDWFKYKYDNNGNLIEEFELDEDGEQIERVFSVYENGLKVEKLYYDYKDRLKQRRTYEYEFRK